MFFFLLTVILIGEVQEFTGREEKDQIRRPLYRAKVPPGWVRLDPQGPITDTTLPNVAFLIENELKVTIHSFPSENLDERIPPYAQIERWKRQGDEGKVDSVSRGGFVGLFLEGATILGWSMQLDLEHYQTLAFLPTNRFEEEHYKQMRADYTIKATGPEKLIAKYRDELLLFAKSFELIQEIPKR